MLARLVVAAKDRTGRNTDGTVKAYVVFQEDIDDAAGKQAAHRTAFQHKSLFHQFHSIITL